MTEETEEQQPKFKLGRFQIRLSESILIAALPVFAYLFTYVYQAGYFGAFELPLQLISVTMIDVFNIGGKIVLVVAALFLFINGILKTISSNKGKINSSIEYRVYVMIIITILMIPAFILTESSWKWIYFTGLISMFLLILFAPPLFTKKFTGSYLQKMELLDQAPTRPMPQEPLFQKADEFLGKDLTYFLTTLAFALILSYTAGRAAAQYQEIYYVANTSPESVVFFISNEKLISAPFDRNTKLVEPRVFVRDITNLPDLKLQLSNLGKLTLDKSSLTPTPVPTPLPTSTPIPTHTISPQPTPTS